MGAGAWRGGGRGFGRATEPRFGEPEVEGGAGGAEVTTVGGR